MSEAREGGAMNKRAAIKLVDAGSIGDYPISTHDRIDSHYFLQWNLKRWRGSEFRKKCDAEVGWYGFNLFCIAQDGDPVGTLADDPEQLAFDLNLPLERWNALCERKISPLHGWYRVRCDNGEIRLAHKIVTEVALEAVDGKKKNAAKNADDRMAKRLKTIRDNMVKVLPGSGSRAADNDEMVNRISDWIASEYPAGSATEKRVREAWDAISANWR